MISSFHSKKRQTIPIAYFARFYLLPEPPIVGRRSSTITDRLAKPLTQLPATVVITLGLLLVGSLCSLLSSPPPGTIRILRSWCLSLVPFGSLGAPSDLAHRFPDHTERSLLGGALFSCCFRRKISKKKAELPARRQLCDDGYYFPLYFSYKLGDSKMFLVSENFLNNFLKIENAGQFCSVRQGFAIVLAQFHS